MLWILPINALVLLVWAHNLVVHWLMPFSSHHNVLSIMPFILLVETLTSGAMIPRVTNRCVYLPISLLLYLTVSDSNTSHPSSSSLSPSIRPSMVFLTLTSFIISRTSFLHGWLVSTSSAVASPFDDYGVCWKEKNSLPVCPRLEVATSRKSHNHRVPFHLNLHFFPSGFYSILFNCTLLVSIFIHRCRVTIAYTEFVSGAVLISFPVCHRSVQDTDHFVSLTSGHLALQPLAVLLFVVSLSFLDRSGVIFFSVLW